MHVFFDKWLSAVPPKTKLFWDYLQKKFLAPQFLFCSDSMRCRLTRVKIWKEFPGVGTTVVLVKPSVVWFALVCGNWGLSCETVLFFTHWPCWKSRDRPDISGITIFVRELTGTLERITTRNTFGQNGLNHNCSHPAFLLLTSVH